MDSTTSSRPSKWTGKQHPSSTNTSTRNTSCTTSANDDNNNNNIMIYQTFFAIDKFNGSGASWGGGIHLRQHHLHREGLCSQFNMQHNIDKIITKMYFLHGSWWAQRCQRKDQQQHDWSLTTRWSTQRVEEVDRYNNNNNNNIMVTDSTTLTATTNLSPSEVCNLFNVVVFIFVNHVQG